jgi:hypothetical protein
MARLNAELSLIRRRRRGKGRGSAMSTISD